MEVIPISCCPSSYVKLSARNQRFIVGMLVGYRLVSHGIRENTMHVPDLGRNSQLNHFVEDLNLPTSPGRRESGLSVRLVFGVLLGNMQLKVVSMQRGDVHSHA